MIESHDSEKEISTDLLHVAVIGAEKNGKSVLTSTAPGNKLVLDFDQRIEALSGKKGVFGLKLKDPQFPQMPVVAEEVQDIVSGLEASLDLSKLKDKLGNLLFPKVPPETMIQNVIVDSMSSFAKAQMDHELYNNKDLRRDIAVGPRHTVFVPKSFDAWNGEMSGVTSIIMRLFALPVNVFCVFHEIPEEALDSTNEKPKYTGRVAVFPARYKSLLKYFNEVWRVKLTAVPDPKLGLRYLPRVYALPDFSIDAATTMLLDPIEEPNIEAMIAKHRVRSEAIKALPQVASATK